MSSKTVVSLEKVHKDLNFWRVLAFIFLFLLLGVSTMLVYTWNHRSQEGFHPQGRSYYDPYLNFSLTLPSGWKVETMNQKQEAQIVGQATGGLAFDMGKFSLPKSLAPLTLYVPSTSTKYPFARYLIVSFRGSDQNYTYLQNPEGLVASFKTTLKKLDQTGVEVTQVKRLDSNLLDGVLLEGEAQFKGVPIHYYRYYQPAGANILSLTYGCTTSGKHALSVIASLVNSLVYYNNAYTPSPFKVNLTNPSAKSSLPSKDVITKVATLGKGVTVGTKPTGSSH